MKRRISANKIWRDSRGSSLVEFTIIMPVLFVLTLGTVDLGYLLFDYAFANKATYAGAHRAIVSHPVATQITTVNWNRADLGEDCSTASGPSGYCSGYAATTKCTYTSGTGSCPGYTFDPNTFTAIVNRMQAFYGCAPGSSTCELQPKNVSVTYTISGTLGFVGEPNGLPMDVTVSLSCMYHTFYFIGDLLRWTYRVKPGCSGTPTGWSVPSYSTTLTSEDLGTP